VTDHKLTVFHNGNDIHLMFDTAEIKNAYIKGEWKYCLDARNKYMSSTDFKEDVKEYLKKRLEYAIMSGFKETSSKYIWRLQDEQKENQTA